MLTQLSTVKTRLALTSLCRVTLRMALIWQRKMMSNQYMHST